MTRRQRPFLNRHHRSRLARLPIKRSLTHRQISSLKVRVIFPSIRPILNLSTFLHSTQTRRLKRTVSIRNIRVRNILSLRTRNIHPQLNTRSTSLRQTFTQIVTLTTRLIRSQRRMTKHRRSSTQLRIISRHSLTFHRPPQSQRRNTTRPFHTMVNTSTTNRRTVTVNIIRGITLTTTHNTSQPHSRINPIISIQNNMTRRHQLTNNPQQTISTRRLNLQRHRRTRQVNITRVLLFNRQRLNSINRQLRLLKISIVLSRPLTMRKQILVDILRQAFRTIRLGHLSLITQNSLSQIRLLTVKNRVFRNFLPQGYNNRS